MDTNAPAPETEHRSDYDMRAIFVPAFALVKPCMEANGGWISQLHEFQAMHALEQQFPAVHGERLFILIATIAAAVASGRTPV
ncbi:hypothetical protein RQP54_06035 [Curvibacter sp. APW13]|uniref:hypothetical protein n=1 Tax=Curvibacter sp. APW13 TaxID=3077236 RepID=UPI0028DD7615|nr:hypothetical protein [Curvibacter sp. APW13]MDT8990422.1 hypothetical protein [Curvibacter sp. APW13]